MVFMCNATGKPLPEINWSKSEGSPSESRTVIHDAQLTTLNVTLNEGGLHVFTAVNSVGSNSSFAELNVVRFSEHTEGPETTQRFVTTRGPLTTQGSQSTQESQSHQEQQTNQMSQTTQGLHSTQGPQTTQVQKPAITPSSLLVYVGQDKAIQCPVPTDSLSVVTWMYNDSLALPDGVATGDPKVLKMTSAKMHHGGNYTCVVRNKQPD